MNTNYFNENGKFKMTISFNKKENHLYKVQVLKKILDISRKKVLATRIVGLPGEIFDIYENCISEIKSIKNGNQRFLIKTFPELVLITKYDEDKLKIINSLSNFNEGNFEVFSLDISEEYFSYIKNVYDFNEIQNFINKYCEIKIQITDDSETFYIESTRDSIFHDINLNIK